MCHVKIITFSDSKFAVARNMLVDSAYNLGYRNLEFFTRRQFLKTDFAAKHHEICKAERGAGYWLWKPYYILDCLRRMNEGEILVYCDAGIKLTDSITPLFELVNNSLTDILVFHNPEGLKYYPVEKWVIDKTFFYEEVSRNKYWVKGDCFKIMNCDEERFWNSQQVIAGFLLFKNSLKSREFVEEWLEYCQNIDVVSDNRSKIKADNANLVLHVNDQAVLSLLTEKYNIPLYRCPDKIGNHFKREEFRKKGEYLILPYVSGYFSDSSYGTLIDIHRTRTLSFYSRLRMYLGQERRILLSSFR